MMVFDNLHSAVVPAKAGIQSRNAVVRRALDPGFRRGDDRGEATQRILPHRDGGTNR